MNEIAEAKRTRLAEALLTAPTREAAFYSVGISKTQAYTWMADPAFKTQLSLMADELHRAAMERMKAGTDKAIETLLRNMDCGQAPAEVRAAVAYLQILTQRTADAEDNAREFAQAVLDILKSAPEDMRQHFAQKLREKVG